MIVPTSTGQVFVSDELSIKNDTPLTRALDAAHPFIPFLKNFWKLITTLGGSGDSLIHCYSLLLFGTGTALEAYTAYVRAQLCVTSPDIILIDDLNRRVHGFHQRTSNVWNYICIDKTAVDRWASRMEHYANDYDTLALEAMIKTTIIHETGHWHHTLRVGPYTEEMTHLLFRVPYTEACRQYLALPGEQREVTNKKTMSKSIGVPWNPEKGESGNFSEFTCLGGIMGFDSKHNTLFLRIDDGPLHFLSIDYLFAFRLKGICRFTPETTSESDAPQLIPNTNAQCGKLQAYLQLPEDFPFWPTSEDTCSVAPSDGPPTFIGLGLNMTIPDCPSFLEMLEARPL